MSISEKDRAFMQQVAAYFRSTRDKDNPDGSIRDTAIHFDLNRNKVRKILITTGDISNSMTEEAAKLQAQGMSIETIADKLGVSTATVSTYLPYTDTIHGGLEPSVHTQAVRDYRAYEKEQAKKQGKKKEEERTVAWQESTVAATAGDAAGKIEENTPLDTSWKEEWLKEKKLSYTETDTRPARTTWEDARQMRESMDTADPQLKAITEQIQKMAEERDAQEEKELRALLDKGENASSDEKARIEELKRNLGIFPGALNSRSVIELEKVSGEQLPFEPRDVRRLHLEIVDYLSDTDKEILRKYGGVKYGESISRDVVVPSDFPLYAIHFLIQRLFGWQNSHLHRFELPHDTLLRVTNNEVRTWVQLVGIIFRSPFMNEDDEFWADDYNGGSFKNWLTKKYTGPYLSQCHGEGIMSCTQDMQGMSSVLDTDWYVLHVKYDENDDRIVRMTPVYDEKGNRKPEPKADWLPSGEKWVETVKFGDAPVDALTGISERGCFDLIERLPVDCCISEDPEDLDGTEIFEDISGYIDRVMDKGFDSPELQVVPQAFTKTLYYYYDFGDNWRVKITVTNDCEDLVREGRITQEQLDKAQIKCRELYRPVTLAVDGEMVMDDVGNLSGFVNFLKTINPELDGMNKKGKEKAKAEKKDMLDWAKMQNWKKLNPMI